MRLFIAIGAPPLVRDALAATHTGYGLRFNPPPKMHVTLRFIGEVEDRKVKQLRDNLRVAVGEAWSPGAPHLSGLGTFPEAGGPPYVLWAGFSDPSPFLRVKATIDRVLGPDPHCQRRPYRPHLTIARCTPEQEGEVYGYIEEHLGDFTHGALTQPWVLDRFTLFHNTGGGVTDSYEVVEEFTTPRVKKQLSLGDW